MVGWSATQTVRRARGAPRAVVVAAVVVEQPEEVVVAAAMLQMERFAPLPAAVVAALRSRTKAPNELSQAHLLHLGPSTARPRRPSRPEPSADHQGAGRDRRGTAGWCGGFLGGHSDAPA